MPVIQPAKPRHLTQDEGSTLKIGIPSRKNILIMLFLGVWMIGWVFGEVSVGRIVLAGLFAPLARLLGIAGQANLSSSAFPNLFMLVWLLGWTAGGAFAIYIFLWQLAGRELIELSYDRIGIRREVFGVGWTRDYLGIHVKDLRVSPVHMGNYSWLGWSRTTDLYGLSGGMLAFDYGAKTIRFCSGIDEAEAKQILREIGPRFPQFLQHLELSSAPLGSTS